MRVFVGVLALSIGVCWLTGCDKKSPTQPVVEACQTNNTARVVFQNRSTISATYDIVFDGARIATVAPASDSAPFDVAAGVQHTLRFQYTNSNSLACAQSTPTYAKCASITAFCAG